MTVPEATEFLRTALDGADSGTWLDLGAGRGTFTRALAGLLGPESTVIAVDRDAGALRELADAARADTGGAGISTIPADLRDMSAVEALDDVRIAGALATNALHYISRPEAVLRELVARLQPGGRIVVVEYDRRAASRWVPNPLPPERLEVVAREAGLARPIVTARRPSAFQGEMYCALLTARSA